jgi:hypothetical protein
MGAVDEERYLGQIRWLPACFCGLALGLGLLAGCAGPGIRGQEFRGSGFAFRIGPIGRGWRPIESSESLLAFRDDRARATVALGGRCGKDGDDVPLAALTRHLFLYFTERNLVGERSLTLDGRAALRTEMEARLDGVPKRFTVVVLKKNGCVYDFLYVEDVPGTGEGRATFDEFVAGFATLG